MTAKIYNKVFFAHKISYLDNDQDVRGRAINEVNQFFTKHNELDILNIFESWSIDKSSIELVVYYKNHT